MKTYTIKAEKFYSGFHFWPLFFKKTMTITAKFDFNCLYDPTQFDQINKLAGFSRGINLHESSVRIGWSVEAANPTMIMLWHYEYAHGVRLDPVKIKYVSPGETFTLELSGGSWFGYRLYPYFGGTKPAPHDMTISVQYD